jgi:hypothetical protein
LRAEFATLLLPIVKRSPQVFDVIRIMNRQNRFQPEVFGRQDLGPACAPKRVEDAIHSLWAFEHGQLNAAFEDFERRIVIAMRFGVVNLHVSTV